MSFNELIHAFHFLRPGWLVALPLVWGLTVWLARRHARDGNWSRLIDPDLLSGLRLDSGGSIGGMTPWPWLLGVWSLAVLALAGPSWEQDTTAAYRAPAAWVLVLDISPSMTSTDLSPNRVTRARYALDDLLDAAHDARVGLVTFSDEAYTVVPLTEDVATIRSLLQPLAPDIMPSAGDHLAPALKQAEKLLQESGAKNKQLILLSDGFDDPASAITLSAQLKTKGITVDVVGIGTVGGAPLQGKHGEFERNDQGQPQMARLDRGPLQQVASAGGGAYFDLSALPSLISELQSRPNHEFGANAEHGVRIHHWLDGGVWLLPVILILAALLARRGWL